MDRLERTALTQYRLIDPFKRYVDDIYFQTIDEAHGDDFHHHMNQQHPSITFEIEKHTMTPAGKSLSLLDFSITLTNDRTSELSFTRKKPRNPFLHTLNLPYL